MIKQIKTLLALSLLSPLLMGCQANTSISDSSQTIMTIGNRTYTKGDEYQLIKRINGPQITLDEAKKQICEKEIGITDEVKKEAEEQYNSYAESYEGFEDQLKENGYEGKDDYLNDVLIPGILADKLQEKYYKDNANELEEEYSPALVKIIECDSEDNANKALEALKNGEEATKVAEQYAKEDATYKGDETLILSDDTSLPTDMLNTILDTSNTGVIDQVFNTDTSTDDVTYYVADIVTKKFDDLIEQFTEHFASDTDMEDEALIFYLTKYDFDVHDQYLFDYWKVKNPEYLVTRPDLVEEEEAEEAADGSDTVTAE